MNQTFNEAKAVQDAEQILNIANRVDALFAEAEAEKGKLQGAWQSQNSAEAAFRTFDTYKASFENFLGEIKSLANQIYMAKDAYRAADNSATKITEETYRINPEG